jgi:calcineurin-like phosphoesterase family protein
MCHYAMRTWHFKSQGSIHLYGHSHGKLPSLDKSMDVGVDAMGYKPIKLERILEIMDKIEIGSNERL